MPDPIRIFWQSFLDPEGVHRDYLARLREHVTGALDEGSTLDMRFLQPPVSEIDRLTELRAGLVALRNTIEAEQAGYDVVAIGHFQEPLLTEMRASVDIPVVGLGEAALLQACNVGQRIGLVTIDARFISWHREQVARHGLEQRVAGIASLEMSPASFASLTEPGPANDRFVETFERAAQPLLEAGADVLVPAGALPSMALTTRPELRIDGAPVLDIVRVAVKFAEHSVRVRRSAGLGTSRRGALARPSAQAVEDFLTQTGGTF